MDMSKLLLKQFLTASKTTKHPVNPENPVRLDESTKHEELLNLSAVVL